MTRKEVKILAMGGSIVFFLAIFVTSSLAGGEEAKEILKKGLLGAGVGAISAEASGGKAGTGALIGAGTSVLGSALLDFLTGGSSRGTVPEEEYYYEDELDEYYYEEPPRRRQETGTQQILKEGLVGAGVGALSAGASGGKAGRGALIGAGTSILGNALLDAITEPATRRRGRIYRKIPTRRRRYYGQEEEPRHKKVIRKYDESGRLIAEEEIYY